MSSGDTLLPFPDNASFTGWVLEGRDSGWSDKYRTTTRFQSQHHHQLQQQLQQQDEALNRGGY